MALLRPLAEIAGLLVVMSWLSLGLQVVSSPNGREHRRPLGFSLSACLIATTVHLGALASTGQDCIVTRSLSYLYWRTLVSPDALLPCSWCSS